MNSFIGCTRPDIDIKTAASFKMIMETNCIKKNVFYHTTPFLSDDSDEEDDEEDYGRDTMDVDWNDNSNSDEQITVTTSVSAQCLPSIWFFCERTIFPCPSIGGNYGGVRTIEEEQTNNGMSSAVEISFYEETSPLPCTSPYENDSAGSSDSEERNLQTMARLHSREPLPKSEDDVLCGNTPPKCPSRVRFTDQPHTIYYEQVKEFEPDVFDFKWAILENMRKKCARENRSPLEGCVKDDDDDLSEKTVPALTETTNFSDYGLSWYCKQQYANYEPLKVTS